jgi:hypothetical protein
MSKQTILFPEPCHEDWDRMKPEGRARFCESCTKPVHDLTHYTPEEAEHLLAGNGTPACVRATILPDGKVLTRPSLMGRILSAAVVTPVISAALASSVMANPLNGSIVGTVKTQAKSVRVTAFGEGVHRSVKADPSGNYHLDNLPAGSYRLVFSVPHAQTWALDGVEVSAGGITQSSSRDPQLPPVLPPPPMPTAGMPMPMPPSKNAEAPKPSTPPADNAQPATTTPSS